MDSFSTEQDARIIIDDLLKTAGWDLKDKFQVRTEVPIHSDNIDNVYETQHYFPNTDPIKRSKMLGRADYVLYDRDGKPLAVIEAKKSALHPYSAKQQTLPYAKAIDAPFIFLTNGELIYFWDYTNDDARIINSFYSQKDLARLLYQRRNKIPLVQIPIPENYIKQGVIRKVRDYQKDAMRALDHSFELGKRRFLIELPTGTGKTDLIVLYIKRLIEAGRADKILFLVDREQLAKQSLDAIQDILKQYSSYWLRPGVS